MHPFQGKDRTHRRHYHIVLFPTFHPRIFRQFMLLTFRLRAPASTSALTIALN
jgi:hypothetical protein